MKYLGIGLCLVVILLLMIEKRKKRRKVTVSHKDVTADMGKKETGSKQVRIRVQRNQWNQINIVCTSMSDKKMGELLSSYTLSETKRAGEPSYTVHLENILVGRKYRKKGIGTCMIVYLLQEMLKIEQENDCEFRYIYGEIGRGGTDDPHISLPFYKKLDGMSYGIGKKMQLQIKKGESLDGYDCFYYFFSKTS